MTLRPYIFYTYQPDNRRRETFLFPSFRYKIYKSKAPKPIIPTLSHVARNVNRQNDNALGIEIGSFSSNIPFAFYA